MSIPTHLLNAKLCNEATCSYIRKTKAYDAFKDWVVDAMTPKTNAWGDTGYAYMLRCDVILKKLEEFMEDDDV